MPYKTQKMKLPRKYDRRVKLTNKQREDIRLNVDGLSRRKLSIKYGVSVSTIRLTQNPEALARQRAAFKERQADGRYYDRERHKGYMKDHRKYKDTTIKKLQADGTYEDLIS